MAAGPLAVIIELAHNGARQQRYTVANNQAISKGILLELFDPRTASAALTLAGPFAGISSFEKESGDGSTTISAWTDGIFDLKASGAITVGDLVVMAGGAAGSALTNEVRSGKLVAAASGAITLNGAVVGVALETATDGEVINVDIGRKG